MDLINKFNYQHVFGIKSEEDPDLYSSQFIVDWNQEAIDKSIFVTQQEEIYSIYINYPALLLRQKSRVYPNGRTSIRFKDALRRKVTIIDKN
tara:strand:+ start:1103 stop:1378 length:276 start_codon:yes stop_codon:yes gene_type:complete